MEPTDTKLEEPQEGAVVAPGEDDAVQSAPFSMVDVDVETPQGEVVRVASVSTLETLAFIKQALFEFTETSFFTNYGFEVYDSAEWIALNEFVEVSAAAAYASSPAVEGGLALVSIRMVPENYDVRRARLHVKRTNELLQFPPTAAGSVTSASSTVPEASEQPSQAPLPGVDEIFGNVKLSNFFTETLFRVAKPSTPAGAVEGAESVKGRGKKLTECVTSVSLSAWNPPPPTRRLQGDLLYVEVVTAEEGIFHLTATASGFYLNKSSRHHFDPSPAVSALHPNAHFSHELFHSLLGLSTALRGSWSAVVDTASTRGTPGRTSDSEDPATEAKEERTPFIRVNALDNMATMCVAGRADVTTQHPLWLQFSAEGTPLKKHTPDLNRTIDDLCDTFGAEDKSAPREWNEEIQSVRTIPSATPYEQVIKARYAHRVHAEFYEACRSAAVAVVEGLVTPLNPMDPVQTQVYVYNSIFFSRAVDTKETYKISRGDEAARKGAAHDLNNQRVLQSLGLDGLSTVLSCLVDYKGERIMAQTIIPGVLMSGLGAARLMYGAVEFGKRLACKTEAWTLLQQIGSKLRLPARNVLAAPIPATEGVESAAVDPNQQSSIRTDDLDEVVAPDSPTVPHIGPVEGKVLKGADGRLYALEFMRLTPRDANYVPSAVGGTGHIADEVLSQGDESIRSVYVIRQELVNSFLQNKVKTLRHQVIMDAASKQVDRAAGSEGSSEDAEKNEQLASEVSEKLQAISSASVDFQFSPNCFLDVNSSSEGDSAVLKSDVDPDVASKDEASARELATFLWSQLLPTITFDVRTGELAPLDCASMVRILHSFGVNVRYLGQLAKLAADQEKEDIALAAENKQRVHMMPLYWLEMLETELASRCFKHLLNSIFRSDGLVRTAPALTVITLLNHLFGAQSSSSSNSTAGAQVAAPVVVVASSASSKKKKGKKGAKASQDSSVVSSATDKSLPWVAAPNAAPSRDATLEKIEQLAMAKYLYIFTLAGRNEVVSGADPQSEVSGFLGARLSRPALLRRICQLSGLVIRNKDYDFSSKTPFEIDDLISLIPLARSCTGHGSSEEVAPLPEARELVNVSRRLCSEGALVSAFEAAQDASGLIQQITGPTHRESVYALDQMTAVLVAAGDLRQAIQTSSKSLLLTVQTTGLDSHETYQAHNRLASLCLSLQGMLIAARNETKAAGGETINAADSLALEIESFGRNAANHLLVCKFLVILLGGARHPELVNIFLKLGALYNESAQYNVGLTCLLEAKGRANDLSQQALIAQAIAEVLVNMGHLTQGLAEQRQCFKLVNEIFGESDERTIEAKARVEKYLRASTERNVKVARQIQDAKETALAQAHAAALAKAQQQANHSIVDGIASQSSEDKDKKKKRILNKKVVARK